MYVLITNQKIQTDTCEAPIPGSLASVSFLSVKPEENPELGTCASLF